MNGGACALGHPIGATGARLITTLLHALRKRGLRRGVASQCIGGGEACAVAIELRLTLRRFAGSHRMQLNDKVVVVTGGARGIGKAIANAFAERGATLALLDLNQADLDATRAEFAARGVKVERVTRSTSRRKTR